MPTDTASLIPRSAPPATPFHESVWILPKPDWPEPFTLDSTGITRRDPDYRIRRPEGGRYFVLECILVGRGHLFIENRHFQPAAGDVYLLPPDVPHEYYTVPADPWEKIWFNVYGELIERLIECYRLTGTIYLPRAGLEQEFRSGMELVRRGGANAHAELAAILTGILATMHRQRGDNRANRSPDGVRLKNYLDNHWREPFSLMHLSREISKSPAQTLRIFRIAWETTPGAYYQKRRFEIAARYLENTGNSVRAIADLLGFANEFHFSAWFKKQGGLAPKHYRDRSRNGA